MNDLISRSEAIEHFRVVDPDGTFAYCSSIIKFLEKLPSAEPEWIPVSKRMPENFETVIVTHRRGVSFAWYNGKYWERGASADHQPIKTVKAWQPLPKPYKEEE